MMKQSLARISPFDQIRKVNPQGQEFWSARDLQVPLGYDRWENFQESIDRAMAACKNSGQEVSKQFRDATKLQNRGNRGGTQEIKDYHMTRFACYLTAMNGDPRKPEIAAAQIYFAVKTREAETNQQPQPAPALPPTPDNWIDIRYRFAGESYADLQRTKKTIAHLEKAHELITGETSKISRDDLGTTEVIPDTKQIKAPSLQSEILRTISRLQQKEPPTIRDIYHCLPKFSRDDIKQEVRTLVADEILLEDGVSRNQPCYTMA